MIHLMLQDNCQKIIGQNFLLFAVIIQITHADLFKTLNFRPLSGN